MRNAGKRLLAAGLLLLSLSGCGRPEPPTVRIGMTLYLQDDTFLTTLVQNVEQRILEEETERNIKINLTLADARSSQAAQNEQVDRFLSQDYDILCVNLVDRTAAAVIIDKAQAEDVPVIFFNREPVKEDLNRWTRTYYVGTPAEQAGRLQGAIVRDAWQQDISSIDRNGDGILQYVMLEGEPGHQDTLLRTEYSIKTLTDAGIETEKLANYNADWQRGQAALRMQQWLETFGKRIEVVFANNDDMALGAIDACLDAEGTSRTLPLIVGVDATPPALAALADGTLYGTVRNDADAQAEQIAALIGSILDGIDPAQVVDLTDDHYVWLEYTPVTASNPS